MKYIRLILIICMSILAFGQSVDANKILNKVKENFSLIKDYEVDIKVQVDVEFLKVPNATAKILFKQPNKVKIVSEGFALLPKEGLNFSPQYLLNGDYTAFFEKEEISDGNKIAVVKVIPLGESKDIVLSTLWIDKENYLIRKVETTTKLNGTFTIELQYDKNINKYPLASTMIFTFNISDSNIPKNLSHQTEDEKPKKKNKLTKGQVIVQYSNYIVNKGIDDKIFEDKPKKK